MQRLLYIVFTVIAVFVHCLPFGYTWTEPPLSAGDFNRTYYLGETVPISWTATTGQWPRVYLQLSPAFIVGITYGTLIGELIPVLSSECKQGGRHQTLISAAAQDNATNKGGLLWKVGLNDGVNETAISTVNKFFLQLSDATGADNYTLASPGFYIGPSNSAAPTTTPQTGLYTAAKVGIGVGISVALIAGITLTLAWIRLSQLMKMKRSGARDKANGQQHESEDQQHTIMPTGMVLNELDSTR